MLQLLTDAFEWTLEKTVRNPLIILALLGGMLVFYDNNIFHQERQDAHGPVDIIDVPWIDKLPEGPKDPYNIYFFSSEEARGPFKIGVHIQGNSYKQTTELFGYTIEDGNIRFAFPNDGRRENSGVRSKLGGPDGFDMTLVLKSDPQNGNEKKKYHSRDEWR